MFTTYFHDVLYEALQGWLEPAVFLNGSPRELYENLTGGYGLLARGPVSLLERVAQRLDSLLDVKVIKTHVVQDRWKALIADDQRTICKSVLVVEHDS